MISTKINELLSMLDPKDDILLILCLKTKLHEATEEFLSKHDVSEQEILQSKKGFERILQSWKIESHNNNKRISKISKVLDARNCDNCKFSVLKAFKPFLNNISYYPSHNENNLICTYCFQRCNKLDDAMAKEIENDDKKWDVPIPLEYFKTKALITKIQNKIRTIKQQKL